MELVIRLILNETWCRPIKTMKVLSVNLGATDILFHLRPLSLPSLSIPGLLNLYVVSETGEIWSACEQLQIQHIKRRLNKYTYNSMQSCTEICSKKMYQQ
jgi:hypothetical protein